MTVGRAELNETGSDLGDTANEAGAPVVSVEAVVVSTVFCNEDSGWSVVRCRATDGKQLTAVGPLLGVQDGDRLRLSGRWQQHPKFGEQLQVGSWLQVTPATVEGIRRFLASGRVKGIGKRNADRLVASFGLETLDVIEHYPAKLRQVKGIGRKTARRISESWQEFRGIQQIMVFLAAHGVAPGIAVKVHRAYGAGAVEKVRSNPYRLADEIFGVGFVTADRIALGLGMARDAPERLAAGLLHTLQQASLDGHVYLPRAELIGDTATLLGCQRQLPETALEELIGSGMVSVRLDPAGVPAVFSPRLAQAEARLARGLRRILASGHSSPFDLERAIGWFQGSSGLHLEARQRQALTAALSEPVVVITGGPGTGKTTLVRGVTGIGGRLGRTTLLAAPTGRAAKRLGEATGLEARTIHRLLEYTPADGQFQRNRQRQLEADLVVVDEVSMLDVELAAHLVDAVPRGCRLVLVGDADQLPSVGPGNVLGDIIASGTVPVVRLQEIFRQAGESLIVVNAHRINGGRMPQLGSGEGLEDFYFVARDEAAAAADTAIEVVTRRIPARFGFDPIADIQVLAPMHRGELGVTSLNQRLQEILTPDGDELQVGSRCYRMGDKVMQVRNNYDLEVFNGDLGRVLDIDSEERELTVAFDDRVVQVPSHLLDDLMPAFACTIHKSQGSEYPAVVVVLHHQHHIMLQRNLLYTAITRGKRLVVVVGSRRALERAVSNATVRQRYTMLAQRLQELQPSSAGRAP